MSRLLRLGVVAFALVLASVLTFGPAAAQPATPELILATTTSTQDSGLLDVLVPAFEHSPIYTALSLVLGTVFLVWTALLWRHRPVMPTMPLFRFSIVYIAALFIGMVCDALGGRP